MPRPGRRWITARAYRALMDRLWAKRRGKCTYCRVKLVRTWDKADRPPLNLATVDHRMPIALGGTHEESNLCLSCLGCNIAKGDIHPDVWAERLRRTG